MEVACLEKILLYILIEEFYVHVYCNTLLFYVSQVFNILLSLNQYLICESERKQIFDKEITFETQVLTEIWSYTKTCSFVSKKPTVHFIHRDKTRVQMPAKMFAVYGPRSWFLHKAKKQFFWSNLVFFYNKNKIFTILFIVKYEKITLKWWVFSVVGAHNQQVFGMFKWGKNKPKQQMAHALVISLWFCPNIKKSLHVLNKSSLLLKSFW